MLSMKQVLCEIESSLTKLDLLREEKKYIEMRYVIFRLIGYTKLLREFVNKKICESDESSKLS